MHQCHESRTARTRTRRPTHSATTWTRRPARRAQLFRGVAGSLEPRARVLCVRGSPAWSPGCATCSCRQATPVAKKSNQIAGSIRLINQPRDQARMRARTITFLRSSKNIDIVPGSRKAGLLTLLAYPSSILVGHPCLPFTAGVPGHEP